MNPSLPSTRFVFNVLDYGAIGDGLTLDTPAIQSAIEACHQAGGGTVTIPAGRFHTGPLLMHSNMTLHLDAGATLLGSQDLADYALIDSRWEGADQKTYAPLIGGGHLTNVAIVGRGTVDGRGSVWWKLHKEKKLAYPRPRLISFSNCANVLIEGITVTNSPAWTINPVRCENVTVDKVTVINPADSPNTDGINPDSCRNVHISNCHVSVGDDCITIKSGHGKERAPEPFAVRKHHDYKLHDGARSRRRGHRQRDERRRAERRHLELCLYRNRSRHPHEISARARRRGRRHPGD